MSFFEKYQEYIAACLKVRALEVAYITQRHSDVEDYMQEMMIYLLRYSDRYNPERSCPHTFINRLAISAKATLLRHLRAKKNRILFQTVEIDYV